MQSYDHKGLFKLLTPNIDETSQEAVFFKPSEFRISQIPPAAHTADGAYGH